jgi:hypothetical protein
MPVSRKRKSRRSAGPRKPSVDQVAVTTDVRMLEPGEALKILTGQIAPCPCCDPGTEWNEL